MTSIQILIVFWLCLSVAVADIIQYNYHIINAGQPEYLIIPKYDKSEVPHWSPGKGRSYIDLSRLEVASTCYNDGYSPYVTTDKDLCKSVKYDIMLFEAPVEHSWEDYWSDSDFCCTPQLVEVGKCTNDRLNSLIVPKGLHAFYLSTVTVDPDSEPVNVENDKLTEHQIKQSGLYVLLMAQCSLETAPVYLKGYISSLDPYGFLPADLFGNLPFFLTLTCIYLIVGVVWLILCIWHWDQLIALQFWISAVLAIAMMETTLLFSRYLDWNDVGSPALSITMIALFFGVSKRALSRILVQLVALGYGVVRPSLGEDMNRVLYLGGGYFVLSLIYAITTNLPASSKTVGDPNYDFLSLIVFLLAVIDTTFYIWIFTSIHNLMVSLAARKQGTKYMLYRNFRSVLFVLLFFTCLWALYGSVLFLNDNGGTNQYWRHKWTVDALWEVIYFVIFLSIAILWAPSNNSQRYAYSIELSQLDDDSEWNAAQTIDSADEDGAIDKEYGGKLSDEQDPFQGTGALDPAMAVAKKQ